MFSPASVYMLNRQKLLLGFSTTGATSAITGKNLRSQRQSCGLLPLQNLVHVVPFPSQG
jgi:hypothetical protein